MAEQVRKADMRSGWSRVNVPGLWARKEVLDWLKDPSRPGQWVYSAGGFPRERMVCDHFYYFSESSVAFEFKVRWG